MKKILHLLTALFFTVLPLSAQHDDHGFHKECICEDTEPMLKGTYEYTWDTLNNVWLKKYVTTNIYNQDSLLTETVWKEWATGTNYTRYLYYYNDLGFNTERITQEWHDSAWVNTIRFIYNLNEFGQRKSLFYMVWSGTKWTYYERHVYYFNSDGLYNYYIRYQFINGDWVGKTINRYYYDSLNNMINRTEQRLSDKLFTVRYLYTYNENNLATEYLRQVWTSGQWINTTHVSYFYNDYNLLSYFVVTEWEDNAWVNTRKSVNLYDYTTTGKSHKVTVCHNGHPICISLNALPAHLAHGDTRGNCETNGDQHPGKNTHRHNNPSCSGNKKSAVSAESSELNVTGGTDGLLIYPNPVRDQLMISLGNNDNNISRADLIDFSGRIIRSVVLNSGSEISIDCSDLPAGIYILRLTGDTVINEKIVVD